MKDKKIEKSESVENEIPVDVLDYLESTGYFVYQLKEFRRSFKRTFVLSNCDPEHIASYFDIPIEGYDVIAGLPKESIIPAAYDLINKWSKDYNALDLSSVDNFTRDILGRTMPPLSTICFISKANTEFRNNPEEAMKKYLLCDSSLMEK